MHMCIVIVHQVELKSLKAKTPNSPRYLTLKENMIYLLLTKTMPRRRRLSLVAIVLVMTFYGKCTALSEVIIVPKDGYRSHKEH